MTDINRKTLVEKRGYSDASQQHAFYTIHLWQTTAQRDFFTFTGLMSEHVLLTRRLYTADELLKRRLYAGC